MPKHPNIGSSLDDFLKQEGSYEDAEGRAIKEVIAGQLAEAMKKQSLSKARMVPCSKPAARR